MAQRFNQKHQLDFTARTLRSNLLFYLSFSSVEHYVLSLSHTEERRTYVPDTYGITRAMGGYPLMARVLVRLLYVRKYCTYGGTLHTHSLTERLEMTRFLSSLS